MKRYTRDEGHGADGDNEEDDRGRTEGSRIHILVGRAQ